MVTVSAKLPKLQNGSSSFSKLLETRNFYDLLKEIFNDLHYKNKMDTSECYIDETFINGRSGGLDIGK